MPHELADMAQRLGRWYNGGVIVCEDNGIGAAVAQALDVTHFYPDLFRHDPKDDPGFRMTDNRKEQLFKDLGAGLASLSIYVSDPVTIKELMGFRRQATGRLEADRGQHDDAAMAFLLAYHPLGDAGLVTAAMRPRAKPQYVGAF